MMVDAQTIALGIAVGEQPSLQHAIRREADPGHHVGRIHRDLLNFCEVVVRVAVELQHADFHQQIISVRPDFGQIEGVIRDPAGVRFRHDLNVESPAREIAFFNRFIEIALRTLAVLCHQAFRFIIHQVGDPLLGFEVEFHPKTFVIGINKAERVAAETVHMAPGARKAAVAEINR